MSEQQRNPAFLIKATYVLHPDDVEAYKSIAARLAISATKTPGCAFLNATQDLLDPNMFHLMEGWESQAAFDALFASDGFQELLKEVLALRITDRWGTRYHVAAVERLPMPT